MSLDGYGVAHGVNPKREPLARFCAYVYYMVTRNGDQKSVQKFDTHLWMPPKGVAPDPRSPWSAERETAAFRAVKAMTTGHAAPTPNQSMRERAKAATS